MNTVELTKWAITRRKGFNRYVIEYTALMMVIIAGVDVLTAGVGVAIDKSGWNTFIQDLQTIKWFRGLSLAAFLGLAAGIYSWYRQERAYKNRPSR